MKKNFLLTFCLACIPGTGAMYLGYMKRGLSQLTLMCGVVALASMLYLEPLLFMLPIIFAYCFFDTWRLRNQTPEQQAANPDAYIVTAEQLGGDNIKALLEKRHAIIGWGCIVVAMLVLYNNVFRRLMWRYENYLPGVVRFAIDAIPSLAVVVGLVLLGLYLLRGPRALTGTGSAAAQDEYVSYRGQQAAPVQTVVTAPVVSTQPELVLAQAEFAPEPPAAPALALDEEDNASKAQPETSAQTGESYYD